MSHLKNLMKTAKHNRAKQTRVTSPLAKYNDLDQLTCIVCKSIVKTDSLWPDHLASAAHKKNVELLRQTQRKRQREKEEEQAEERKRQRKAEESIPVSTPLPVLTRAEPVHSQNKEQVEYVKDDIPADFFDDAKEQLKVVAASNAQKVTLFGGYTNPEEMEEEERALRDLVMELEKKNAEEESEEVEEEDDDEVVGVVDLQYEPVHEPLSITPQKVITQEKKAVPATTTTSTWFPEPEAGEVKRNEEDEYERYLKELEEEKQNSLKKLETLKQPGTGKFQRTLPGVASTLKKRKKQQQMEEENSEDDLESWRSMGW